MLCMLNWWYTGVCNKVVFSFKVHDNIKTFGVSVLQLCDICDWPVFHSVVSCFQQLWKELFLIELG